MPAPGWPTGCCDEPKARVRYQENIRKLKGRARTGGERFRSRAAFDGTTPVLAPVRVVDGISGELTVGHDDGSWP